MMRATLIRRLISPTLLVTASFLLAGCGSTPKEQELAAPMAEGTRPLTEVEVANLPNGATLAESERLFGRGEPQSANRLAYLAAKQPGKYFWLYPYESASGTMVHHIVLADRLEEDGKVIWPAKWRDMSPASAAYVLDKMQRQ
jgi:hypothetical protein